MLTLPPAGSHHSAACVKGTCCTPVPRTQSSRQPQQHSGRALPHHHNAHPPSTAAAATAATAPTTWPMPQRHRMPTQALWQTLRRGMPTQAPRSIPRLGHQQGQHKSRTPTLASHVGTHLPPHTLLYKARPAAPLWCAWAPACAPSTRRVWQHTAPMVSSPLLGSRAGSALSATAGACAAARAASLVPVLATLSSASAVCATADASSTPRGCGALGGEWLGFGGGEGRCTGPCST